MLGASARYSRLYVPVETSTPPHRRKVHSVQYAMAGVRHFVSLLLRSWNEPAGAGPCRELRGYIHQLAADRLAAAGRKLENG